MLSSCVRLLKKESQDERARNLQDQFGPRLRSDFFVPSSLCHSGPGPEDSGHGAHAAERLLQCSCESFTEQNLS
jgi:hypothetical protein